MASPPDAPRDGKPDRPAGEMTQAQVEIQARREALPSARPFEGTAEVVGVAASPYGRDSTPTLPPDARPRPKNAAFHPKEDEDFSTTAEGEGA